MKHLNYITYLLILILIIIYYACTTTTMNNSNVYLYTDGITASNMYTYDDIQYHISISSNITTTNASMVHGTCSGIESQTTLFFIRYSGDIFSGIYEDGTFSAICGETNSVSISDILRAMDRKLVYYPYLNMLIAGHSDIKQNHNIIRTVLENTTYLHGYTYNNNTIVLNGTCSDNNLHVPYDMYTPDATPLYENSIAAIYSDINIVSEDGIEQPYICSLNGNFVWDFFLDDASIIHLVVFTVPNYTGTPPYTFDVIIIIMTCWLGYLYTTQNNAISKREINTLVFCNVSMLFWNLIVAVIYMSQFLEDAYMQNIKTIFTFNGTDGKIYLILFLFNIWLNILVSITHTFHDYRIHACTASKLYLVPCIYNYVILFSFIRYSFFPVVSVVWFLYSIPCIIGCFIVITIICDIIRQQQIDFVFKCLMVLYMVYTVVFLSIDLFTPLLYVTKINMPIFNILVSIIVLIEINLGLYMSNYITI